MNTNLFIKILKFILNTLDDNRLKLDIINNLFKDFKINFITNNNLNPKKRYFIKQ